MKAQFIYHLTLPEGGVFRVKWRTEIYINSSDPNTNGNLDKFRGKMRICRESSNATKECREGGRGLWHLKYRLQFIFIRVIQIRMQIWIHLQKTWRLRGRIHKLRIESSIYVKKQHGGSSWHSNYYQPVLTFIRFIQNRLQIWIN